MLKNMEEQKEMIKEKLNQRIDKYFDEFEKGSNEAKFTINDIERLMLDNQRKMKDMMAEATSDLSGSVETVYKKMPKMRGRTKANQKGRKIKNKNHVWGA